jgi:actin-related protein
LREQFEKRTQSEDMKNNPGATLLTIEDRHLLIDSRQRRMVLVIPSSLPLPLLSTVLDTLFNNFQPPTIALMSAPVLTAVAAGIRSALIVDIGWAETVVSSIYEYREVQCRRSTRGTKLYGEEMYKMLSEAIDPDASQDQEGVESKDTLWQILSFEECEEIIARVAWCKPSKELHTDVASQGLAPVTEEDELGASVRSLNISKVAGAGPDIMIPLRSTNPPGPLRIPFSQLAEPCETALLGAGKLPQDFDDEELPLHLLVYHALLLLPVDVRSMCMSRIVFVGGGSNLLGLKERIMDDVKSLVEQWGWDPVRGKAVEQLRENPNLQSRRKLTGGGPTKIQLGTDEFSPSKPAAAFAEQEPDHIETQIKRHTRKQIEPDELGFLRAVESLGAWSGGSLVSQLKVPAVSIVDREQWHQHGAAGASQEIDVSATAKRQSMGAAAFKSGAGDRTSWTLGVWG